MTPGFSSRYNAKNRATYSLKTRNSFYPCVWLTMHMVLFPSDYWAMSMVRITCVRRVRVSATITARRL